jgi:hypothetical protein
MTRQRIKAAQQTYFPFRAREGRYYLPLLSAGHGDNEVRGSDSFFGQALTPMLGNINTEFGQKFSQNDSGSPIIARIPDAGGLNREVSV